MSCCPETPPSAALGAAAGQANGSENDIRPGETIECYMARAGNTTGQHADATENVPDTIEQNSIPIKRTATAASIDPAAGLQFTLVVGSTRTPTSWTMTNIPPGLTFTTGGKLSGTFSPAALGQIFKVSVAAIDGTGTIDTRAFVIAPTIGDESTQIQLITPLPGAIINSRYGLRLWDGVMKPHTGVDMVYANKSVGDVVAAADGVVLLPGGAATSGYGNRVWIKHFTGSGKHLCTTTYNHLAKIYVAENQRVMAGQKIGLEGTTGHSTGNHLHFECKLPDGKFIDPEPLIRGSMSVARKTLPNNDADPANIVTRTSEAALSGAESEARSRGCEPFGPGYPAASPPETTDPTPVPPTPSTDPFENAWYFTMTAEVGPFWTNAYPSDPDVIAGAIETSAQRRKCGYVDTPNYPGGTTKFGIAQKPNPKLIVKTCTYADAKQAGFNNYWKSSKISCVPLAPLIAVMQFDLNFLHGDGNARGIYNSAGISGVPVNASRTVQLAACQALHAAQLAFIQSIPRPEYTKGWKNRSIALYGYVQAIAPTLVP